MQALDKQRRIAAVFALGLLACKGDQGPRALSDEKDTPNVTADDAGTETPGPDAADGEGEVTVALRRIGRYESGIFDQGASEIVAFDPANQQVFQINASSGQVDVLDLSKPSEPMQIGTIDVAHEIGEHSSIGTAFGGVNSVAVRDDIVAVVIEAEAVGERGAVAFFTAEDHRFLAAYEVGYLPDSIALSPDGSFAVVANEGEPNDEYTIDPEGSITVLDLRAGVDYAEITELGFTDFSVGGPRHHELAPGVRIYGMKDGGIPSTVAEDLEPEYVTISPNSQRAFVSLQENNAIAVVNLTAPAIHSIFPLALKDHALVGNELDPSDRDDIRIRNWPVKGLLQPDGIAAFAFDGETFIVTANEGEIRDYEGFSEETSVRDLDLDKKSFPDAKDLRKKKNVGSLSTTTVQGDTDGDGDFDELFAFGGRSFSIVHESGRLIYDSGSDFEKVTAYQLGKHFNADNDDNKGDKRSNAKGPEPEAVAVGNVEGELFAFIGLERVGGIMVYNISNPYEPRFVQYTTERDFSEKPSLDADDDGKEKPNPLAGDLGPESIAFVHASKSPNGQPLLVVGNEVSGTTAIYLIDVIRE